MATYKYTIEARRAGESEYGTICEGGAQLEFETEDEARTFARDNIEGKSRFIVSWCVTPIISDTIKLQP